MLAGLFCRDALTLIADRHHIGGFFFWMDLISTLSATRYTLVGIFDATDATTDPTLLRASRASKLGGKAARIARVAKVVRVVRLFKVLKVFFDRGKSRVASHKSDDQSLDAAGKVEKANKKRFSEMGHRLSEIIAKRVAALVMLSIFAGPLLMVADVDRTMYASLNQPTSPSQNGSAAMSCVCRADGILFQYDVHTSLINVSTTRNGETLSWSWIDEDANPLPRRRSNVALYVSGEEFAAHNTIAYVNAERYNRQVAMFQIFLIIIIVALLLWFSGLLTHATRELVVNPLGRIMNTVQAHSAALMQTVKDVGKEHMLETDLLESVMKKMATAMKTGQKDEAKDEVKAFMEDSNIDAGTRQWLTSNYTTNTNAGMGGGSTPASPVRGMAAAARAIAGVAKLKRMATGSSLHTESTREALRKRVGSWGYNSLDFAPLPGGDDDPADFGAMSDLAVHAGHIISFELERIIGRGALRINEGVAVAFARKLKSLYKDTTYHCFAHGVDAPLLLPIRPNVGYARLVRRNSFAVAAAPGYDGHPRQQQLPHCNGPRAGAEVQRRVAARKHARGYCL